MQTACSTDVMKMGPLGSTAGSVFQNALPLVWLPRVPLPLGLKQQARKDLTEESALAASGQGLQVTWTPARHSPLPLLCMASALLQGTDPLAYCTKGPWAWAPGLRLRAGRHPEFLI